MRTLKRWQSRGRRFRRKLRFIAVGQSSSPRRLPTTARRASDAYKGRDGLGRSQLQPSPASLRNRPRFPALFSTSFAASQASEFYQQVVKEGAVFTISRGDRLVGYDLSSAELQRNIDYWLKRTNSAESAGE